MPALVERLCGISGGILDRQSGDAGLDRACDMGGDFLGFMREAALEIGIDGQIDRAAQRGEMRQHVLEGNAIVGLSDGPRKACARGSDRLEA